jgi:hypothetical protein
MLMLMPPYHGAALRADEKGILEHFSRVAAAGGVPIMVQDAPLSGVALSVPFLAALAREVRGRFLALRSEDFVMAARLDGSRERRLIFRHILPSLWPTIIVAATLRVGSAILTESFLSFLGLGAQEPTVTQVSTGPSMRRSSRARVSPKRLVMSFRGKRYAEKAFANILRAVDIGLVEEADVCATITHFAMTQLSMKAGLKRFKEKGEEGVVKP